MAEITLLPLPEWAHNERHFNQQDREDIQAYARECVEADRKAQRAAEPSPGLLMSMAMRYDHGLALPGYYDQMNAAMKTAGMEPKATHAERLKSTLRTMRQLWEEVTGNGFYAPELEAEYAAKVRALIDKEAP